MTEWAAYLERIRHEARTMRVPDKIRPIAVDESTHHYDVVNAGTRGEVIQRAVNATFTAEDMDRLRNGYGCPRCWEAFSQQHIDCPVCGLAGDEQRAYLERTFEGERWVGPDRSIDEIRTIDDENELRDIRDQLGFAGGSTILVPSLPTKGDIIVP